MATNAIEQREERLLLVARVILDSRTRFDLSEVMARHLPALIRYDACSVGICHLRHSRLWPMEVAACGFRRGALEELFSGNGGAQPMELYAHFQQGLPLILDAQETSLPREEEEERLPAPCALESTALHGIVDLSGEFASYICMRKTRQRFSDADYTVLRLIAPYMNSAILQVRRSLFAQEYAPLRRPMVQPTVRELEILGLLYVGKTNKEIGRTLGISAMTVKNHTKNIYAKLTARNRWEAASKAARLGLLKPGNHA